MYFEILVKHERRAKMSTSGIKPRVGVSEVHNLPKTCMVLTSGVAHFVCSRQRLIDLDITITREEGSFYVATLPAGWTHMVTSAGITYIYDRLGNVRIILTPRENGVEQVVHRPEYQRPWSPKRAIRNRVS